MNVSVPASAPRTPPDTGASTMGSCAHAPQQTKEALRIIIASTLPAWLGWELSLTHLSALCLCLDLPRHVRINGAAVDEQRLLFRRRKEMIVIDGKDMRIGWQHRDNCFGTFCHTLCRIRHCRALLLRFFQSVLVHCCAKTKDNPAVRHLVSYL